MNTMHTIILTEEQVKAYTEVKDIINESVQNTQKQLKKRKPIKRKIKVMPQYTMFSPGNVNMMRSCDRDVALPELVKMGTYVGYNYTPKGMDTPIIGNGIITDSKEIKDGHIAYKIEKDGNIIWVPDAYITTVPKK